MTNLVDEYGYPDKLRAQAPESKQRWGRDAHKPHWREDNTDYDFPRGWGQLDAEAKDIWYKRQRAYRQAWRQWDAGAMMGGFSDEQLDGGLTPLEAVDKLSSNPYRFGNDD
jgi:hypothetical protein